MIDVYSPDVINLVQIMLMFYLFNVCYDLIAYDMLSYFSFYLDVMFGQIILYLIIFSVFECYAILGDLSSSFMYYVMLSYSICIRIYIYIYIIYRERCRYVYIYIIYIYIYIYTYTPQCRRPHGRDLFCRELHPKRQFYEFPG